MNFEVMNNDDLEEVLRIEKENFSEPWPRKSFEYDLNNEVAKIVTLKDEGKLIGYFVVYYMFENADLAKIAVDKKYQGKGYGKRLLKKLIQNSLEREIEFIHLEVSVENTRAISMYKAFGFEELRIRKGYYHGTDAIDMMKGLIGLDAKDFSD